MSSRTFVWVCIAILLGAINAVSQTGTPAAEVISRENRARTESYAGNSVDTGTGAFVLERSAISVQGIRALDFNLRYNSLLPGVSGALGFGWSHGFEAFITGDPQGTVTVNWDANRKNDFRLGTTTYTPLDEAVRYDRLVRNSGTTWTLTRLDGTVYSFGANGQLTRIANKVGQGIETRRVNNVLAEVVEPKANRRLVLQYARDGSGLVQAITDATNRVGYFGYDSSRRLTVVRPPVTIGVAEFGDTFAPKNIPDNNPAGLTHTINVTGSAPIGLVEFSVVNLSHSRPADLTVTLISPQGTQVVIRNPVANPTSPSPNPWDLSEMILDNFDGEIPQGIWTVIAVDSAPGSIGQLNGWRMRFTERTDPTRYTYDSNGRILRATGPDSERLFVNTYDALGRVITQDDGVDTNAIATFSYEAVSGGGVQTTYRDRTGRNHLYNHDSRYHLVSYTDPLGNLTSYTYDSLGNRIRVTDPLQRATIFGYDANGYLTSVVDPKLLTWVMTYEAGNLSTFTDPLGRVTRFTHDSLNNLTQVRDARNIADNKTYSSDSQLLVNLMSDGGGITYAYTNGILSTASHPADAAKKAGTTFDAIGRVTQLTDPDGNITKSTYDSQSRVIVQTDALNRTVTKAYDRRGRLISQTDRRGNATSFRYDNNDNVIANTDSLGLTTRYEYDGEDRRVRTIDALNNSSSTAYDAAGRTIQETDPLGATTSYEYDAAGNLLVTKDTNGVVIERNTYDELGLVTSRTDALGNQVTTIFNEVRRPIEFRDPLRRISRWTYDQIDRLIEVQDPLGRRVRQTYEDDDVIESITDARGNVTQFSYDLGNRITSIFEATGGRVRRFTYNGRDQLVRETQTGGERQQDYTYDSAGRLSSTTRTNLRNTADRSTLSYGYDENGNLTEVRAASGTQTPSLRLSRGYDSLNRMSRFTDGRGNTLLYAYDAAGNLKDLTYPDGKKVTYIYDSANRMTSITDWAGRVTRYTYDENGLMTRAVFPNRTTRLMTYDLAGRMTRRRDLARDGSVIVDYKYSYDAAGQLLTENGTYSTSLTATPSTVMAYDTGNQLTSVDGQTTLNDDDGNLTRFKGRDLRYDLNNSLTLAGNVSYVYDEEDRLISFSSAAVTTSFVVNPAAAPSQVLVRTSGGAVTRYVYGAGLVYEETATGQIRTYHYDMRGSTAALADTSGAVTSRVGYGPYGEVIGSSAAMDTPFLFHGLLGVITDPNGFNYMRFRWYAPELKRFLNRDAHFGDISRIDSLNRFAFVGDSPMMRVDPEGQFWWVAAGALVGAVTNVAIQAASDIISGKFSGWQAYAGAAVGGAVTGAIIAACPGCAFAAGSLGAAAGYAAGQGFRGEEVDPGELALQAAIGGAAGSIGAKLGPLASRLGRQVGGKIGGKLGGVLAGASKRQGVYGRSDIIKNALKADVPFAFLTGFVTSSIKELATLTGATDMLRSHIFDAGTGVARISFPATSSGSDSAKDNIQSGARQDLNRNRKSAFGEFIHWKFWVDSLQLAGRPLPNNPNNLLTSF